ncbi:MAG TPA: NADPH-dependent glutamate synthase [Oscillospiraceae bacterium]|nr:NADPH-dependent glutamate synthase [Oscillospiraceae bacterium]HPK34331.1 NADPH-dependent glutamate synthase [Oscillospiraceae bacterium]HPR75110.1 NADPH-dependent glutamate synthase [Oscillospiraceae bacterium]
MPNMNPKKTPSPEQAPDRRINNFKEVALGYDEQQAIEEAARCIECKNPKCVSGCPVNVQIPQFIKQIKDENFLGAYDTIYGTNSLPAVCGRVCPQESQCEGLCVRGIKGEPVGIGRLERFAADYAAKQGHNAPIKKENSKDKKVAVVGSGPAGLACAAELVKRGYGVTVFEAFHKFGGVLAYGIPEFRLPKSIVADEVDKLRDLGVQFQANAIIGKSLTIDDLFEEGYKAVFLGTGAGLPKFLGIPGENLIGVFSANEYLTRINLMKAFSDGYDTPVLKFDRVAVVGGGNVAMDAARCARRMGSEVYLVYRRTENEMPARAEERHHAKEEGILFQTLTAPIEVVGDKDGMVTGLKCRKMALGEPDASGRARPVEVPGSDFVLETDAVIAAIGTSPNPIIAKSTKDITFDRHGCAVVGENSLMTTRPGVFAGGDLVSGAATVILAMGAGKQAAAEIDEYLSE